MKEFGLFLEAMAHNPTRVVLTTTSVFVFWFFAAWSLGFAPVLGAGFASSEDVKGIKVQLLAKAIIDARIQYCTAPTGTRMKSYFLTQVNEKAREYRGETGISYSLPDCEELVLDTTDT